MRLLAASIVLCALLACSTDGEDLDSVPKELVVQGMIVEDSLIVYLSEFPIRAAERAMVDEGGTLGFNWTRLEFPALPTDADFDLTIGDPITFSQELGMIHPWTDEPMNVRFDFAAGEPGLSGRIATKSSDQVGDGGLRVTYQVAFRGMRAWFDDTPSYLDFDSANDATLVPEDRP